MEKKSDVVQNMALFCRVTATGDGMCQDTVFLREATSQSLSLLKTLTTAYNPGTRSERWRKQKEER